MSYILEALRKSEQERNADKVPDLTTSHTQIHKEKKSNKLWWIIGVMLIVINGGYLLYVSNQEVSSTEADTKPLLEPVQEMAIETPIAKPIKEKTQEVIVSDVTQSDVENNVVNEQQPQLSEAKPIVKQPEIIDSKMLPDITTLSYNVQQQLPAMEYTTHIHVKEGGSFIIINGRSFGEGQQIIEGLTIVQIQSDGIILDFKGRRFFMPSMTDWINN